MRKIDTYFLGFLRGTRSNQAFKTFLPFPFGLEVLCVLLVEQTISLSYHGCHKLTRCFFSNPSSGMFEIAEASGVRAGTKIIIHLKEDCKEFANEDRVKGE